ncbi:hypothetical protein ABZ912_45770 [Nonomuraea angiospora]|uniref:hypothetical protein n=1 Tax=Nonomuraea angiospora TaxID=46172 RepID=UPI0033FC28B4
MTRRRPAICDACARLRQRVDAQAAGRYVPYCEAFPEGVPAEIYEGGFDHRHEYPGDGGVRFAPRPTAEGAVRAFELRRT